MPTASKMKMINGRVSESAATKASRTLAEQGLTISAFIRNSIEHIAHTGEVPKSGMPAQPTAADRQELQALVASLEALPMPGRNTYSAIDEDKLADHVRMERYGY